MNGTNGHGASEEVDRRTFLFSSPRRLLKDLRTVWGDVTTPTGNQRIAVLDISRCLAWGDGDCQLCYLRCPLRDHAIVLNSGRPVIAASACDGCGVCVDVCRSVNDLGAIQLVEVRHT